MVDKQEIESKLSKALHFLKNGEVENCFLACDETEKLIFSLRLESTNMIRSYDQMLADIRRKLNSSLVKSMKSKLFETKNDLNTKQNDIENK